MTTLTKSFVGTNYRMKSLKQTPKAMKAPIHNDFDSVQQGETIDLQGFEARVAGQLGSKYIKRFT